MNKKLSLEDVSLLLDEEDENLQDDYNRQILLQRREIRSLKKTKSNTPEKVSKKATDPRSREWA